MFCFRFRKPHVSLSEWLSELLFRLNMNMVRYHFFLKIRNDKEFCSSSRGFVFLFDLNIFNHVTYKVIIGLGSRRSLYIYLLLFAWWNWVQHLSVTNHFNVCCQTSRWGYLAHKETLSENVTKVWSKLVAQVLQHGHSIHSIGILTNPQRILSESL